MHFVLAYLDPTSGSLAFQIAISSVLAAAATARIYWKRLKEAFARLTRRDAGSAASEPISELELQPAVEENSKTQVAEA